MVTTLASDNFTGTTGAAWSSTWALGTNPSAGGSVTIQSNTGQIVTGSSGGNSASDKVTRRIIPSSGATVTDACWQLRFTCSSLQCFPRIYLRNNDSAITNFTGYFFQIDQNGSQYKIGYDTGFFEGILDTQTFTFTAGSYYNLIYGVVGSTIKYQIWADGSAQPSTYTNTYTDTNVTAAGYPGVAVFPGNNASVPFTIDDVFLYDGFPSLTPTGSATLSGSGTLTAAGDPGFPGAAALSDSGTLTAAGSPKPIVSTSFSGSGTLTLAGTPKPSGSDALSGSGTLTGSGVALAQATGSVALSGSGTLTGSSSAMSVAGTEALTGSGTLTATGVAGIQPTGTAALSGSGTLTGVGMPVTQQVFNPNGSGTLTLAGTPATTGSDTLGGSGTLTATGVPKLVGVVGLSGSGTVVGTQSGMTASGGAILSGVGNESSVGIPNFVAPLSLAGSGTLQAQSFGTVGEVDMTGSGTLTLVGRATSLPVVSQGTGWYGLLSIMDLQREYAMEEQTRIPTACPNDGEPLSTGPNGELFCTYDGWQWDGRPLRYDH